MSAQVTDSLATNTKPDAGLMLSVSFLLIAVPFAYSHSVFDTGLMPKFMALMIGAVFVALSWLRMEYRGEAFRVSLPTDLPIFLYLLIVILQWPRAYDVHQASLEVIKVFTFTTIYMAITRCSVRAHWEVWTSILAIVGTIVSAIGICQYLGVGFLWLPSAGFPSGTFGYRNTAAMFIITVLPFAVMKFVKSDDRRSEVFWAGCWAAMLVFLIYTRARGAWVGWFVSMIVGMGFLTYRYGWKLFDPKRIIHLLGSGKGAISVLSIFVIGASGLVGPSAVTDEVSQASQMPLQKKSVDSALETVFASATQLKNGDPGAGSGRLRLWTATSEMIDDQPVRGVGLTNWEKVYPRYMPPGSTANRRPKRPHNDYLWIWSELGVLGLLAYLGIFVAVAITAVRSAKNSDINSFGLAAAAFSGIVAIQGHAFFSFPLERVGPLFVEWFCLALLALFHRESSLQYRSWQRLLFASGAAILVVLGGTVVVRATVSEALTASSVVSLGAGRTEQALDSSEASPKWGVFDYRHLMYQSEVALVSGQIGLAYAISKEVVRRHPYSPNGLKNLGKVAYELKNYEVSTDAYRRAIEVMPEEIGNYKDLGSAYELAGESGRALELYDRGKSYDSNAVWIPHRIGNIYYGEEDFERALLYYKSCIALQRNFAPAYFGIGNIQLRRGKKREALDAYKRGLSLNPDNVLGHYAIAILYLGLGKGDMAIEHLRETLRLTNNEALSREVASQIAKLVSENQTNRHVN